MLYITIPAGEFFDEKRKEFVSRKEQTLQLEHSLVSLRKWESKWHKPFLSKTDKTLEEVIDYIKCMTITQNVKPETYELLTDKDLIAINEYIHDPMTATTFSEDPMGGKANKEVITAELIYYWMIVNDIPSSYEKWHLNSLLTLIRVCGVKNAPPKKVGKRDRISQYSALNAARRKKYNSRG